jgi:hypothetical protein
MPLLLWRTCSRVTNTPITHTRHICPQVKVMSSEDTEHKDLFKRNLSHGSLAALGGARDEEAEFTVSGAARGCRQQSGAYGGCWQACIFRSRSAAMQLVGMTGNGVDACHAPPPPNAHTYTHLHAMPACASSSACLFCTLAVFHLYRHNVSTHTPSGHLQCSEQQSIVLSLTAAPSHLPTPTG